MPGTDRIPDGLVLAAVQRAQLHLQADEGVAIYRIKAHLGLPHTSWTTRLLNPQLEALVSARLLSASRIRGRDVWKITAAGRRRAAAFSDLPEAPQHRAWREARQAASERIGGFREDLRRTADQIVSLLDGDELAADSETWFKINERLRSAWLLGSATYCLREWPEPSDDARDVDDSQRLGRRNTRLWERPNV